MILGQRPPFFTTFVNTNIKLITTKVADLFITFVMLKTFHRILLLHVIIKQ